MTQRKLIAELSANLQAAGIQAARRELLLLTAHVLNQPLAQTLAKMDQVLDPGTEAIIRRLAARRTEREPLAYLTGTVDFAGLTLTVGPGVLVPRPDSETLVEATLAAIHAETASAASPINLLDTCTGTGAIGIAIAENLHRAGRTVSLHLVDISDTALVFAQRNMEKWCDGIPVFLEKADLFPAKPQQFDVITANPPYIQDGVIPGLMPEVSRHEPELALAGGPDGLAVYRRLLARIHEFLKPGGLLLLEHGFDQAAAIADLIRQTGGFTLPKLCFDYGGNPRVTMAKAISLG